ncbi:hypothetical protein ACWD4O_38805 [Streptomyces sp. NPDC002623]
MQNTGAQDELAVQALSNAGAMCGVCGDEPGDRRCPDCETCRRRYIAVLRAAGWAPLAEVQAELTAVKNNLAQLGGGTV